MVNSTTSKITSTIRETLAGANSSSSTQVSNAGPEPSSERILGQDLTRPEDMRDGAHTPLAWKEAKRAADSKIITEMPEFKK
ncbi:hypothetical protein TWF694_010062 [Orbilia ellipsospora]|uniref:Uncharacterized protein n=1 Tax=Orbilia ellipsospora TaxID=2528407 RepID=A0AAV9X8R5_9PEZI